MSMRSSAYTALEAPLAATCTYAFVPDNTTTRAVTRCLEDPGGCTAGRQNVASCESELLCYAKSISCDSLTCKASETDLTAILVCPRKGDKGRVL